MMIAIGAAAFLLSLVYAAMAIYLQSGFTTNDKK